MRLRRLSCGVDVHRVNVFELQYIETSFRFNADFSLCS